MDIYTKYELLKLLAILAVTFLALYIKYLLHVVLQLRQDLKDGYTTKIQLLAYSLTHALKEYVEAENYEQAAECQKLIIELNKIVQQENDKN